MTDVSEPPTGVELALEDGRQRLLVSEIGAGLRSWTIGGRELLATFTPGTHDAAFCGKVLMPWPNRVRDGRYRFDGLEHRLEISEPERTSALHGLVLWSRWRGVRSSSRRATFSYELHPQPGYPFSLRMAVDYELYSDGLDVTLRATNVGERRAPFGAGLHPYLTTAGASRDDVALEVPARTRVPVDDRLLPAGVPAPVDGTDHDFRRARAVGAVALDTCFGDLDRDPAGVARVRLAARASTRMPSVWMDDSFRFVQVYAAPGAIAIEPMTCAPDAFNSGAGLLVLEPGASFTGRCGLTAAGV
jgi:aldose 1-epimerase